ncbi:unnamed protein product [Vicia faba]|uniref:Zinc knuckle CX2CX4HX4C domain-containing protein n=1 Tax=Vicia faba TaxID=3906 RepID=A0AAV0YIL6_VICFA|nr:unnamed protein product [Vicia faba]
MQVVDLLHGLSQEYWRPKITFSIDSSLITPTSIDSTSSKLTFDRTFGHFVWVLVDIKLVKELTYQILMERAGFGFFAEVEYEKLPTFCSHCKVIGHTFETCRRRIAIYAAKASSLAAKSHQQQDIDLHNYENQQNHVEMDNGASISDLATPEKTIFVPPQENIQPMIGAVPQFRSPILELIHHNSRSPQVCTNIANCGSHIPIEADFLKQSWANLSEIHEDDFLGEAEEDPNYEPFDFQLAISKSQKNKAKTKYKVKNKSSTSKKAAFVPLQ